MGLQEQIDQLKKRLRAARTLSAFEANSVETRNSPLRSPLGSPVGPSDTLLGPSQVASPRTADQSRGQWRQFMEEKRQLIARANHDREKLMNENRQLRAQLLREQGFSKYHEHPHTTNRGTGLNTGSQATLYGAVSKSNSNIYSF